MNYSKRASVPESIREIVSDPQIQTIHENLFLIFLKPNNLGAVGEYIRVKGRGRGFPKGEGGVGPQCISRCRLKGVPARSYRSHVPKLHAPTRGQPSEVRVTSAEIFQGT